jgi:putative membrane protein
MKGKESHGMNRIALILAAALLAGGPALALAQTSEHGKAAPAANASRNAVGDDTKKNAPEGSSGSSTAEATPGRNSFTEGQAKSRIEASGFENVTGLKKGDDGIWTGQATKDGRQVTVQLDYQGDVLVKQ